ncbi:MAG: hypothetical protein JKY65_31375 [Planctomycetes bacterium]|nr:hypothetical protein [Planctomycetota bacterium]
MTQPAPDLDKINAAIVDLHQLATKLEIEARKPTWRGWLKQRAQPEVYRAKAEGIRIALAAIGEVLPPPSKDCVGWQ